MLQVENLSAHIFTEEGVIRAVDDVNFAIRSGEILGLVGESGCGKSMTALSVLRLVPNPPGRIVSGRICFEGNDLLTMSPKDMRRIRGGCIGMVFQEPASSLNPVWKIGQQIAEAVTIHQNLRGKNAREEVCRLLELAGISSPSARYDDYPHQLSGGMRQRVMLAMAISSRPKLLIADEPTTALDVTVQAQILDLLLKLKEEFNMAMLFITHDLGIVSEIADRVAVMYAGKIVEEGDTSSVFSKPLHPYTRALMDVFPRGKKEIKAIPGRVPDMLSLPRGCHFRDRCSQAKDICGEKFPETETINFRRKVNCWNKNE